MIIDFTLTNFLSFKNTTSISFETKRKKSYDNIKLIDVKNTDMKLFAFSTIYGPNASGKSNLISAIYQLKNMVTRSQELDYDHSIPAYRPHKLDRSTKDAPIIFEIEFLVKGIRYYYYVKFDKKSILRESLYFYPKGKGRSANIYNRVEGENIKYGRYFSGEKKIIKSFLQPNQVLLSLGAKANNETLKDVYLFFRDSIRIHTSMDSGNNLTFYTTKFITNNRLSNYKTIVQSFLSAADLNVVDIDIKKVDKDYPFFKFFPPEISEKEKQMIIDDLSTEVYLAHLNDAGDKVPFNLLEEESSGTVKMYDIAHEIISSLRMGTVLVFDEFNSGLHPSLNKFLVKLFNDEDININNAQLLISTHDTCVLDVDNLKREQVWLVNKDDNGNSDLYSIDEFDKNKFREGTNFAKHYLDGRFGAVPAINYTNFLKELFLGQQEEKTRD